MKAVNRRGLGQISLLKGVPEAALDDLRRISAANITAFLEGRPQDVFRLVPAP